MNAKALLESYRSVLPSGFTSWFLSIFGFQSLRILSDTPSGVPSCGFARNGFRDRGVNLSPLPGASCMKAKNLLIVLLQTLHQNKFFESRNSINDFVFSGFKIVSPVESMLYRELSK